MTEDELREVYNILVECWKDYKAFSKIVGKTTEDSLTDWDDYIHSIEARTRKHGNDHFQRQLDKLFMADLERRALERMEKNQ